MKKSTGKRGNGGFSLVELIIVIAIMAVLVGVLAPQYLSYIHKAKVAADQANLKNYFTEIQLDSFSERIDSQNAGRIFLGDRGHTREGGDTISIIIVMSV